MIQKFIFVFTILFTFLTPIQAKNQTATLLIPSEGNYYYVIQNEKANFQILAIHKESIMPITCLNNQITNTKDFSTNQTAITCIQESIQKTFHIPINHYVLLDSKKMASALHLASSSHQDTFDEITTFFLKDNHALSLKDCIHLYQSISSDLSIMDIYHYYQLFTSSHFHYQKQYPVLLYQNQQMIPISYHAFS